MSTSFEIWLSQENFIKLIKGEPVTWSEKEEGYMKVNIALNEYDIECVFPRESNSPKPHYLIKKKSSSWK